jgi:hypothetical protein
VAPEFEAMALERGFRGGGTGKKDASEVKLEVAAMDRMNGDSTAALDATLDVAASRLFEYNASVSFIFLYLRISIEFSSSS